jgi:hypothetical protein
MSDDKDWDWKVAIVVFGKYDSDGNLPHGLEEILAAEKAAVAILDGTRSRARGEVAEPREESE